EPGGASGWGLPYIHAVPSAQVGRVGSPASTSPPAARKRLVNVVGLPTSIRADGRGIEALQRVAELLAELAGELGVVEALVLGARMLDLERAHQVADPADGHPVAALLDAEDQ